VILNLPSLDKFEPLIVPGGVMVINSSLVNREVSRKDVKAIMIPAQEIAEELGNRRLLNMVMLGALLEALPILPPGSIEQALDTHLPERHRKFLKGNIDAIHKGAEYARREKAVAD
jgi:2-oxoglutarate ferredoxin oxidoreductase subunit gamma